MDEHVLGVAQGQPLWQVHTRDLVHVDVEQLVRPQLRAATTQHTSTCCVMYPNTFHFFFLKRLQEVVVRKAFATDKEVS